MTLIEAALEAIELLEPGESINYTFFANKYGVSRSTLSRRHRGVQRSRDHQYEEQRILTNQQDKELIKYINKLTERGLFASHEMLRNFAKELTGKKPGKHWPGRFLKRHQDDLISTYTTAIDAARKQADSAYKYTLYFELLSRKLQEYELRPEDIYNMDEKGFMIGMLVKGLRIFSKSKYQNSGLKQRLQDGNREWITSIACICADGTSLPPGLIYQAISGDIQDSWLQDFDPEQHGCFFASSPSGWTNDKLGLAWLKDIFDRYTKEKARRRWRLLILDGHGSHLTMEFINYCDDNKILLMTYPPYSTHSLQPLDVGIFSPLATAYSKQLEEFLHKSMGLSHITKRDFFRLFWPAWEQALSSRNILSSWKTVGISPLDPEIILQRFTKKKDSRPSTIFYSPRKVQQARDLQKQKDEAIQLAKASKEEEKVRRQQAKEEKQRLLEERKRIRASQQELRRLEAEQKKQQKDEERLAKEADRQLQDDFQQAKKIPKKSSKASRQQNLHTNKPISAEVVAEAPPTVNRRGRQIRLPHRFRSD
ncbi:hypothetical protein CNMCM8689_001357 [Aspergillus fumigatus]|nr:hypothetical protein CNMCM8689_001357 [Aspergillus fumigatus]KAJ8147588.1 hypothetical protein LV155_008416 [Aspergillus fumigatus]KAJ8176346.1 hypothetical protein LV161_008533 [Aspergillus fumigatus]KAJ8209932.1 hypothetical protein LV158_005151 [Aspergillus fumigatus]